MYNKILSLYKRYQKNQYQAMHKRVASKHLQQVEARQGRLSNKLRLRCNDYAQEVFGSKRYAPYLYVYSAMQNGFKEGWIPDNYYGEVMVPKLKGDYGKIANLKTLQGALFSSNSFPDLFYYVNGQWLTKEYKVVSPEFVNAYIESHNGKYVYKVDNSQSGKGVFIQDEDLKISKLMHKGNGVLQSYINQHSFFEEIIANSVATVRLTTVNDEQGKLSLRGAYLRVGRATDDKVITASGLRIPIEIKNGKLGNLAYDNDLRQFAKHPDTGYVFAGKTLPNFQNIIQEVLTLHLKVPFARIVGWDVVVDKENNTKVMEWNGMHNGVYFDQLTKGPIFKGMGFENLWKENSR